MTVGWPVSMAAPRIDPYLAATLWLLERAHWAIIAGPEAYASGSVHAKTLMESVVILDGTHSGPLALHHDLGVVLAAPSAAQLAGLRRSLFDPSAQWFLILSNDARERELQEAWLWAQSRPAPAGAALAVAAGGGAASEPLLTEAETWALTLRAGREAPLMQTPRRGRMRLIPGGRE